MGSVYNVKKYKTSVSDKGYKRAKKAHFMHIICQTLLTKSKKYDRL
jgi:hypothetical protein